jgi:WD40 repeat protein
MLAIGSHDNNVYVYKCEDWSLLSKCEGHHSYITALDWSEDSKWIRTNSGDYELLFWEAASGL